MNIKNHQIDHGEGICYFIFDFIFDFLCFLLAFSSLGYQRILTSSSCSWVPPKRLRIPLGEVNAIHFNGASSQGGSGSLEALLRCNDHMMSLATEHFAAETVLEV